MSTSPNKPCGGERSEATTQYHERFIEHQRLVLLRYLDGTAPGSAKNSVRSATSEAYLRTGKKSSVSLN